ncbi:hypothetical protein ACET3Z_017751 [Daucus carota]
MMMMLCNLQTLAFIRTYTYRTLHTTATSASLPSKSSFLNCGFSVKTHFCASNVVPLQSCSDEDRPTSVLKLFQDFGFSQSDITRINSKQPGVLTFHPDKYIKPKLEFLLSITKSESESATGSDENAAAAVITNPFVLSFCLSASFMKNIEFLQEMGVPQSQILKLITKYGQAVGEQHTKFCKVVLKVKGMGLDLSSSYFIDAVRALSFLSDEAWESRCEMYRSYGFCDDDIFTMFKKHPTVMSYSEKRMRELLDFFIYKLGWSPSRLSNSPNVLQYSLHKRTVPRCSVLQALVLKQCNNRSMMLSSILAMTDSKFMEIFVTEYDDEITEVMDAYQGKLRFDEYNFEQEMKANLKG